MALVKKTMFTSIVINAPVEEVFARVSDHEKFLSTLPLSNTTIEKPGEFETNGLGAIRAVAGPGGILKEEITAFDPPHSFEYLIIKGPRQPRHEFAKVSFFPDPEGTRVDWESRLSIKLPFGARVVGTMVQQMFVRVFAKALKNLAEEYKD